MAIRIEQDARLITAPVSKNKPGLWFWTVWMEGEVDELDRIERVRYQLHPTFAEPLRIIDDRASKFRIEESAWGEFTIYAMVRFKDGARRPINHWLRLAGDSASGEPLPYTLGGQSPKLYLSYTFADTHMAQAIARALRREGVHVLDRNDDAKLGNQWAYSNALSVDEADVAGVFISHGAATWLQTEISYLRERDIDIIPIVIVSGETPEIPPELQSLKALPNQLPVQSGDDPVAIAARILELMPALRSKQARQA